ncbi:uncharacterized protein MONOS_18220 [Monocercomonoides exilis]|uniref:uncharacterized protein n=1 Tax=Monocercomonoides exilis TaxID=2049356 RepID=UPI003559B6B9|nr:hypothetical protein MONOS_18220 [Monocercomonoides exilis]
METRESSSKGAVDECLGSLPDDILKMFEFLFMKSIDETRFALFVCDCCKQNLWKMQLLIDSFVIAGESPIQSPLKNGRMCENQVSSDNSLHAQDLPSARLCISRHFQISAKFGRRLERELQIRGEHKGMERDIANIQRVGIHTRFSTDLWGE